jgi:hypothetical protein
MTAPKKSVTPTARGAFPWWIILLILGGGAAYAMWRFEPRRGSPPAGVLGPSSLPLTVKNLWGFPAYNDALWRDASTVQEAFAVGRTVCLETGILAPNGVRLADASGAGVLCWTSLGYGPVTVYLPDHFGEDPHVRQFQEDWNFMVAQREHLTIAGAHLLQGVLNPSGKIDASTLNAIEIAFALGFGWRAAVAAARELAPLKFNLSQSSR